MFKLGSGSIGREWETHLRVLILQLLLPSDLGVLFVPDFTP